MPTTKELREQRAPIRKELLELGTKIKAEGRAMTAEERTKFDKLSADFGEKTRAIQDAEGFDQFEGDDSPSDPKAGRHDTSRTPPDKRGKGGGPKVEVTEQARALALQGWCRAASGFGLKKRHADACKVAGLDPNARSITLRLPEKAPAGLQPGESRDMGVSTSAGGGVTVAPEFVRNLERALKAFNGPRQVADVMRTSTGALMPWPTMDDTSNEGEMVGENTAVSTLDAALASVNFSAYKFGSKAILVSYELLNDSAFNFATVIAELCGERIGRIQARKFTVGTGSGEPQGIVTGAAAGVTAGSPTGIAVADLVKLKHSVDPAYRDNPACRFMFHDQILAAITLLTDGQGRPIFVESFREGSPDTVLKKPVVINQYMPSVIAASAVSVLFGDMSKFKVRDVGTLRFRRLDERYAEKDQTGFVAFLRSDSRVLNAGQGPIKKLTH